MEQDEHKAVLVRVLGRPHVHHHRRRMPIKAHGDGLGVDRLLLFARGLEHGLQLHSQLVAHQANDARGHFAARMLQELTGTVGKMNELIVRADKHAGRGETLQQILVPKLVWNGRGQDLRPTQDFAGHPGARKRKHGQARFWRGYVALVVDAQLLVLGAEQVVGIGGLSRTQDQVAVRAQCVVEQIDHVALHWPVKVDQQVAARDHVKPGEGRVAEQVVRRKHHQVAQLLADPIPAVLLAEKALETVLA